MSGYVGSGILQKFITNGDIDTSWATNGIVEFQYGVDTYPYTMVVQSDGKILVSGVTYISVSDAEFFLARFNPDGTPDNTFNGDGKWIGSYTSSEEVAETMIVQPDGKIILAGRTYAGAFSQLLFARINSDGTLDTGFGTSGYTEIDASPQDERINSLGLLSNGDIIGVGYGYVSSPWFGEFVKMAKLDPNGNPDTGFGTNGVIIPSIFTDISVAWDCIVVNDTIIISATQNDASNNENLAVTKLDQNGNADPNFGTSGISTLYVDPKTTGYDIERYADGKLYICGTAGLGGMFNRDFLLVRYNYNGSIDNTFNSSGYVKTPIRPDWDEATAMDFQADGKIVLAGFSSGISTSGDNDRILVRYLNDFAPPAFNADFTVDNTTVCQSYSASFTDQSAGSINSWEWTFEGGTPATSTSQNPVVTYNTLGDFDVKLVISDGTMEDSTTKTDYINVIALPGQPDVPSGVTGLCGTYQTDYATNSTLYATSYDWVVTPIDAGTMVGNGLTASFESSSTWYGSYTVKVRGVNSCDNGPWSPELQCELYQNPAIFWLEGEGGYCTGSSGSEITLDNSELNMDYELYKDGIPTGIIEAGTGNPISFGIISDDGLYTAIGYNVTCSENMNGEVWVHEVLSPLQPTTPAGPEQVCDNDSSWYSTTNDPEVAAYTWSLTPEEAGSITHLHDSVLIMWTKGFSGTAVLNVFGTNDCGDGPVSDDLLITVNTSPDPYISGPQEVCSDEEELYFTDDNAGNTYIWTVEGGSITAGAGTYQVTVLWGSPGMGSVVVTEETAEGCSTTTFAYEITIDECIFINERSEEKISIYPNPANTFLNIKLATNSSEDIQIWIFNSPGELIERISVSTDQSLFTLQTGEYKPGVYYLHIISENNVPIVAKFMVNR